MEEAQRELSLAEAKSPVKPKEPSFDESGGAHLVGFTLTLDSLSPVTFGE